MAKRKGILSTLAEASVVMAVVVGTGNGPWVHLYHKDNLSDSIGTVAYVGDDWKPSGDFGSEIRDDIAYGLTTAFPEIVADYNDRQERKKKFEEIISSGD